MQYIPKHVAIIPDGNRRWAKEKRLQSFQGHVRGFELVIDLANKAHEMGVEVLTFWAFSTENWNRSKGEVNFLMGLFSKNIDGYLKKALEKNIRIIHIGRKDRIPHLLKNKIIQAEEKTSRFSKLYLVIALDYGGRDEVVRAIKRMQNAEFGIRNIDEESFGSYLDTKDLPYPNPDLVIRTSGELRTSGFMIWQTAYSEYIFVKKYFPDFSVEDFAECVKEYSRRARRFGK